MKTTVKHISDTKIKLTISLGQAELDDAKQVALVKLSKDIKVAGFRKGKIPISVVAKNVDQNALQEKTVDNALNKAVARAFTDEKIQILDRPSIEVTKYVPDQTLEFTAEAEVLPPVKLSNYKSLSVKLAKVVVTDHDVNDVIERVRSGFATKNEVQRAAADGDEVIIDFTGKKDGVAFDGGTATDYTLTLGTGQFIPGFEEGIVGRKAGQTFDLPLTFPKDYHVANLKGAKVVFTVTLKTVKEVSLPELSDELAAKAGPFTSVKELKDDIKRELTSQKERESKEKLKDELVNKLAASSTVPAPDILISDQERSIQQDFEQNLKYRGMTLDQYIETSPHATKEVWLDKDVRPAAEKRVKAGLVLAELSKAENISISDEEINNQIDLYKKQYANNKEALEQLGKPEVRRDIASRLLTEKTVERLVELNSK